MKKVQTYILSLARDNVILLKEDCSDLNMKKRLSRVKYNIDKYGKGGRTVVYCETSDNVDVVSNYLSEKFPGEVVKCHINMGLDKLEKHASRFLSGSKRIVVCARGLETMVDVPDMRLVIYFNLPVNIPEYYWMISRAGQDGKKSHAILLYHPDDTDLLLNGLDKANISRDAVRWICDSLNEMVSLAESDRCLMQQVLKSMGEDYPTKCRHCTNCQKDRRKS